MGVIDLVDYRRERMLNWKRFPFYLWCCWAILGVDGLQGFRLITGISKDRFGRRFLAKPSIAPGGGSGRSKQRLVDLMVDLWQAAAYPEKDSMGKEFCLSDYSLNRSMMKGFLNHFLICKDCSLDNCF